MPFLKTLGSIGQSLLGGLFGIGIDQYSQKTQYENNVKLMDRQKENSKELTEFNRQQQMQMWKDTSYPAQVKMMNEAGINPGLMYGMGGGGGQTANVATGNAASGSASNNGSAIMGMMLGMAKQRQEIELLEAQKQNIEADTNKKNVEATKTETVDTDLTIATISNIKQNTNSQQAQESLTRVETSIKQIDQAYQAKTLEDRIDFIHYQTDKALNEFWQASNQTYISNQTYKDTVVKIKAEALGAILANSLTRAKTAETNASTTNIQMDTQVKNEQRRLTAQLTSNAFQEIMIKWESLSNEQRRTEIGKIVADFNTADKPTQDLIIAAADALILRGAIKQGNYTPIRGFGKGN